MTRRFNLNGPQSNAADLAVTVTIRDESVSPATAYDLTGVTVKFDLRNGKCARVVEATSPSSMIDLTNAASGEIGILIPATSLKCVDPGSYELGVVLVDGDGNTSNPIIATVQIIEGHPK